MKSISMAVFAASLILLASCGDDLPQAHSSSQQPPAHTVGGFSIMLPAVTLQPGEEQTPCYLFPLQLSGPSHYVGGGVLMTGHGMHHGNITTRQATGQGFRPCPVDSSGSNGNEAFDLLQGGTVLFASSTQISGMEWQIFPQGMAFKLRDQGYEIVARMHYLNASSQPITVAPSYQWFTIDEATVTQPIEPYVWDYDQFSIPPNSQMTVTGACKFPRPMHLVTLMPHMHKLGTAFHAGFLGGSLDGQDFLSSPGYDPDRGVIAQYDPAVDLSQGLGVRFSCTWNNTFDKTITYGIGDNEMCMVFGYAYPPENAFSGFTNGPDPSDCIVAAPPSP